MRRWCLMITVVLCVGGWAAPVEQADRVPRLIAQLRDADTSIRATALRGLLWSADPRAVEPLLALLREDDATGYFHGFLLRGLGAFADPRVLDAQMAALTDPREPVRRGAADGLSKGGAPAVARLRQVIAGNDPALAARAMPVLAQFREPEVLEIVAGLLTDPRPPVAEAAALALAKHDDGRAVPYLLPLLAARTDPEHPTAVPDYAAIVRMGDAGRTALEPLLRSTDAQTRRQAAEALGQFHDNRVIPPLRACLQDADAAVRGAVATALAAQRDPALGDLFLALANDPLPGLRATALAALGTLRDPRAAETLILGAGDIDSAVRLAALEGLAKLHDPRALDFFLPITAQATPMQAQEAYWILSRFREPRVLTLAAPALTGDDPQIRYEALEAIAHQPGPQATALLFDALRDKEKAISEKALGFLFTRNDPLVGERALALLTATDQVNEQLRALQFLRGHAVPASQAALLPLLTDVNQKVRLNAACVLADQFHDARALPVLIEGLTVDFFYGADCWLSLRQFRAEAAPSLLPLLAHPKPFVRRGAAGFLGRNGDDRAIPGLLPLLKDDDAYTRVVARDALANIKTVRIHAMGLKTEHVPALRALVGNADERPEHRLEALRALAARDDPRVDDLVVNLLREPLSTFCRQYLFAAANLTTDPRVPPLLLAVLKSAPLDLSDNERYSIYNQAYQALIAWSDPAMLEPILASGYGTFMVRYENQRDPIFEYGVPIVEPLLALAASNDYHIRSRVAMLLNQCDDPRAKTTLAAMLQSDKYDLAHPSLPLAAWAKGDFTLLKYTLNDCEKKSDYANSDKDLATYPAQLATLPPAARAKLADLLLAWLADVEGDARHGAMLLLGYLRDPRAVTPLLEILSSDDAIDAPSHTRYVAAYALGFLGDPRAVDALLAALDDPDVDYVRNAVIDALGRIGDPRAVPALLVHYEKNSGNTYYIRLIIATALARLHDPRTADLMLSLLREIAAADYPEDAADFAYAAIANYLGARKDPRAIAPLIEQLRDVAGGTHPNVAAAAALRQITGQPFGAHYARWKRWSADSARLLPSAP